MLWVSLFLFFFIFFYVIVSHDRAGKNSTGQLDQTNLNFLNFTFIMGDVLEVSTGYNFSFILQGFLFQKK